MNNFNKTTLLGHTTETLAAGETGRVLLFTAAIHTEIARVEVHPEAGIISYMQIQHELPDGDILPFSAFQYSTSARPGNGIPLSPGDKLYIRATRLNTDISGGDSTNVVVFAYGAIANISGGQDD